MILKKKMARFGRGQITNIWEVLLSKAMVDRIAKTAKTKNLSMSWVVRFCIFKTIHQDCSNIADEMSDVIDDIKQRLKDGETRKRFFLCLYGDDELHLRIAARKANLTVSMMIRLAIYLYLDVLEEKNIPQGDLFWFGIKFTKEMKLSVLTDSIDQDFLIRILFDVNDFWGIPPGTPRRWPIAA